MTNTHVPDPGPTDMEAMKRVAAQGIFLREHIDLISPWRFPLPVRIQLQMGRLVKGWQACAEKANERQT